MSTRATIETGNPTIALELAIILHGGFRSDFWALDEQHQDRLCRKAWSALTRLRKTQLELDRRRSS